MPQTPKKNLKIRNNSEIQKLPKKNFLKSSKFEVGNIFFVMAGTKGDFDGRKLMETGGSIINEN